MKELEESRFPGMSSLSHENHEAGKVKRQIPILAIIGDNFLLWAFFKYRRVDFGKDKKLLSGRWKTAWRKNPKWLAG